MHILLFGASGHVGTGLARLLSPDHRITGIVRRQPAAETPYRPLVVPRWVDEPDEVTAALAAETGRVDAVIAAIGGWYIDAPLLERGLEEFDSDFDTYLRGHFTACAISQRLADGRDGGRPTHLALNGVASVEALAGSGAISVFGAAQKMLIEVAAAESTSVDFRELRVMAPIGGDDRNDLTGGVETVGLAEVAEAATAILSSPERFDISTEIDARSGSRR